MLSARRLWIPLGTVDEHIALTFRALMLSRGRLRRGATIARLLAEREESF